MKSTEFIILISSNVSLFTGSYDQLFSSLTETVSICFERDKKVKKLLTRRSLKSIVLDHLLETAFFFPWALALRKIGWFGFSGMMLFLGLLVIGFIYELICSLAFSSITSYNYIWFLTWFRKLLFLYSIWLISSKGIMYLFSLLITGLLSDWSSNNFGWGVASVSKHSITGLELYKRGGTGDSGFNIGIVDKGVFFTTYSTFGEVELGRFWKDFLLKARIAFFLYSFFVWNKCSCL